MAIDAKIKSMEVDGTNLILTLEARVTAEGHKTLAGQDQMTVLDFQYKPDVGDEIWGGADRVEIVRANGRPTMHYKRIGYTELREDHEYAFRSPLSPRYA